MVPWPHKIKPLAEEQLSKQEPVGDIPDSNLSEVILQSVHQVIQTGASMLVVHVCQCCYGHGCCCPPPLIVAE